MTRYTYKGYVLLNGGGYCRVYHNGEFVRAWPYVTDCKMMINASIREGKTLEEYMAESDRIARNLIASYAQGLAERSM